MRRGSKKRVFIKIFFTNNVFRSISSKSRGTSTFFCRGWALMIYLTSLCYFSSYLLLLLFFFLRPFFLSGTNTFSDGFACSIAFLASSSSPSSSSSFLASAPSIYGVDGWQKLQSSFLVSRYLQGWPLYIVLFIHFALNSVTLCEGALINYHL